MSLSLKETRTILSKSTFVFDLDGTLYLGSKPLDGAREMIEELRARNKKILFLTNNSSRSVDEYLKKLRTMGFGAVRDEILMSTHSLTHYLSQKRIKRVYLLGTPAMRRMLDRAGIKAVQKDPDAVVVGFDKTLTYDRLLKSSRWIAQGIPYLVTHPDYFCPTPQGPEPDCGAIAMLLELATKKKPLIVLGKPHPLMMKMAMERTASKQREMVLFGDRLATDIEMAGKAGIDSVFVLTGDNTRADLRRAEHRPSWIIRSVKEFSDACHKL